jgi:hypothetical protein
MYDVSPQRVVDGVVKREEKYMEDARESSDGQLTRPSSCASFSLARLPYQSVFGERVPSQSREE